jgi:hypothetical protein
MLKPLLLPAVFAILACQVMAHNPDASQASALRTWHIEGQGHLHASFLLMRHDSVLLETENGAVSTISLSRFSQKDRQFVASKMAQIEQMNRARTTAPVQAPSPQTLPETPVNQWVFPLFLSAILLLTVVLILKKAKKPAFITTLLGVAFLLAFKTETVQQLLSTDPLYIDSAFQPFKPHVATHWDGVWFYVESNGLPTTHSMMTGITAWQQQVPTPQCYIGENAWQIPLNPVLADTPTPVNQQHFLRGAVAIAANGIPIFNPYTNTGVDAFLDGQLDQWGGHSGRADDYHYHIAPMFLDTQSVAILPIAFALDGFAVYAGKEPNGVPMLPLDANHGHFGADGVYHYHGTASAPYMIGKMVGKVTEDSTLQIIPQARARPVRPSLTPLSGAVITDFVPNAGGNGYILTYTRNGQTYKVDYSWTNSGVYTYNFIAPNGTSTQTYTGHLPCQVATDTDNPDTAPFEVQVYPNPTPGKVFFKIGEEQAGKIIGISLFDISGRQIYQKQNTGTQVEISDLTSGIYLAKIKIGQTSVSKKIVVQ